MPSREQFRGAVRTPSIQDHRWTVRRRPLKRIEDQYTVADRKQTDREQTEEAMRRRVRDHLAESIAVKQACLDTLTEEIAAADFVGRSSRERAPIPAIALTTDISVITAVGNDLGFDQIFARQVEALVREGDVVIVISTSGRSENVIRAAEAARRRRARVVALTGRDGGTLATLAHVAIRVPADSTPRIQEAHIAIGHAICAIVDEAWPEAGADGQEPEKW